jgi:transposase InsO family protein
MFIKDNSAWINIDMACEIFELNRSAYYEWLSNYDKHLGKAQYYNYVSQLVISLFYKYKRRYGAERLSGELNKLGINYSPRKVSIIMRENHLLVAGYKKFRVTTTNSNHKYKVFDNLLERNFTVNKPNQVYVGDITYIRTNEGWLYLATVIDLFSRKLVGYSMGSRMTKDLVIVALQKALKSRGYPKGVIFHSDRGSQYASNEYKRVLKQLGCIGSMSKKCDCWDNAVAESFFATLKKEYVYQTIFKTRLEAQLGIFDYIEAWYNKERIHSTLNGLSPNEFENNNKNKFLTKISNMSAFKGVTINV